MAAAVESMAYAGEVPWHGLGVQVSNDLTPKEMLVEAGLDWSVSKREIFTYDNADPDTVSYTHLTLPTIYSV